MNLAEIDAAPSVVGDHSLEHGAWERLLDHEVSFEVRWEIYCNARANSASMQVAADWVGVEVAWATMPRDVRRRIVGYPLASGDGVWAVVWRAASQIIGDWVREGGDA